MFDEKFAEIIGKYKATILNTTIIKALAASYLSLLIWDIKFLSNFINLRNCDQIFLIEFKLN